MKKTRFTETQIVSILKQQEAGRSVKDICREHSISDATFYNWKSKSGKGKSRLKRMYANLPMDNEILRDLFTKKGWALPPKGN